MNEDKQTDVEIRFERIYNMMECKSYLKKEDIPESKEIFVYGFKHNITDKVDNYILTGCHSDDLYENDKLFNFCFNKFINKELEKRDFKITRWSFTTLGKRNNFFKNQGVCY